MNLFFLKKSVEMFLWEGLLFYYVLIVKRLQISVLKGALTRRSDTTFGNWKPFENNKKSFLLHLKSSFGTQDI